MITTMTTGEDPDDQLLTEYWTSLSASNRHKSFMPISPAENAYAQRSASFQENNPEESFVQIPAADSDHSPPYSSFPANNQDDRFSQISTTHNGYTPLDALITPPQSSKDTSLPLETSEYIDNSNLHGHRRTRRTRTRAVDTNDGPGNDNHDSNLRTHAGNVRLNFFTCRKAVSHINDPGWH